MVEPAKEGCASFFTGDCAKIMGEMRKFCTEAGANRKEFAEKYPHMAALAGRMEGMMSRGSCGPAGSKETDGTGGCCGTPDK